MLGSFPIFFFGPIMALCIQISYPNFLSSLIQNTHVRKILLGALIPCIWRTVGREIESSHDYPRAKRVFARLEIACITLTVLRVFFILAPGAWEYQIVREFLFPAYTIATVLHVWGFLFGDGVTKNEVAESKITN
ncbi:hypothetical protein B0J11DRAFT_524270 [Dendryphion nanum]|uniref:Uncharacterized protein n=1 Tax=Dendryphion nanum TaxID=256645 RepID=A0A9P9IR51_9PLEO|nr:hypothetical protein B0J11DRAFT_524270 [Dendryphion nanum]